MQMLRAREEKILIIDADASAREILRSHMEQVAFKVIEADTGREGLSKAFKEKPDLVILEWVLPDMDGVEVCRQFQEGLMTRRIPVMFLTVRGESEDALAALAAGAYEYMIKPVPAAEVVSRVQAFLRRSRQDREANPLTGLPGGNQINSELESRIGQKGLFALLHADLDSFKAFNDYYGFLRGDQAIKLLAVVLEEATQLLGNPDDFIGHIGGDDFAVITTPDKAKALCSRIISDFDRRIAALYDEEDIRRGYIQSEDRLGGLVRFPLMTLSIGGVTNEHRRIDSHPRASEIAAEVRRRAKTISGSSYYFDQRENGIGHSSVVTQAGRKQLPHQQPVLKGMPADFVSLIAHELRTPVTAVRTSLEILMKNLPEGLGPEHRQLLDIAFRRAKILASTVSELTTYDRIQRGELDLEIQLVNLSEVVDQALAEVKGTAEEKGISLGVEGLVGLEPLMLDRGMVAQALGLLLDNAVKFTPPQGMVKVKVTPDDSAVRIAVRDTGVGISKRELATIFRSFRQIGKPSTHREPGLGLGLYLVKKLVGALGGRLEVQSDEGAGSTFTIVVPKNWRSSTVRVKALQEALALAVNSMRSQLRGLSHNLRGNEGLFPKMEESLDGLRSRVQELEVLANRAMFLVERNSRHLQREEERALHLRADVVLIIEALVSVIERHKPFALGVSRRVASHALRLAREVGLPKKEQDSLYCAALLHDLGMVVVPPGTLMKEGPLVDEEWVSIQKHPKVGAEAISNVQSLAPALPLILSHQERYDGLGYPQGLRGWDIPRGARILAVVVAYDAMVSARPHRPAMSPAAARECLVSEAGKGLDPQAVKAFLHLWEAGDLQRL